MGMDVFGNNGNYFRANIWQWRAICYAMELSGYEVPASWTYNSCDGLSVQAECNKLSDRLYQFLISWDGEKFTYETETVRVDDHGCFVELGTPNSHSPYWVTREHLHEFIEFLRACGGFEIH